MKRWWTDKQVRYKILTCVFVVLILPTVTIWRTSIPWLAGMSIIALVLSSLAALEGATPVEEPASEAKECTCTKTKRTTES